MYNLFDERLKISRVERKLHSDWDVWIDPEQGRPAAQSLLKEGRRSSGGRFTYFFSFVDCYSLRQPYIEMCYTSLHGPRAVCFSGSL